MILFLFRRWLIASMGYLSRPAALNSSGVRGTIGKMVGLRLPSVV